MPCYHPLPAWYAQRLNESGKRGITFKMDEGFQDKPIEVPCGTCIGCRLMYAQRWAMRCVHESKCWSENHFATLTYDVLPEGGTLVPEHFVLFMKRLRKHFGEGIRFFQVGEYGSQLSRPHHHALFFNLALADRRRVGSAYHSQVLEDLWGHGFVSLGEVNYETAGYCARYSLKKVRGERAVSWYGGRVPEYCTMSRRPGIGRVWADRFLREWYSSDSCIIGGKPAKPPRYYDDLCKELYPDVFAEVKRKRLEAAIACPDNTGRRLIAREGVKEGAVSTLTRSFEGD